MDNLLASWREFLRGKRQRRDVAAFSVHFMENIFTLHEDLKNKIYRHGGYQAFKINDPKPRDIHKASVRDRLLHHSIYRILYPYFDCKFIYDSYSCRINKGTHHAIDRFWQFGRKVSENNMHTCWVLKGDIRKFFASIHHDILENIMAKYIADKDALWLCREIISSFNSPGIANTGLPLGNLTSQLFVNIYMNEFYQFMKRKMKAQYYIRYADDFVVLHQDRKYLADMVPEITIFLERRLKLELHPKKVFIKTLASGVDFLGWVNFSKHRILRTSTKRGMLKNSKNKKSPETLASYLGLLVHGNAHSLSQRLIKLSKVE